MNLDNLHKLIDKYEDNLYELIIEKYDEIYKWKAAKQFRDVWFDPKLADMVFSEKFNLAKKYFANIMDNSSVNPSTGIVKVAEKDQEGVSNLFNKYLFTDENVDIKKKQNNIEVFIDKFNELCEEYFPGSFKYKQERHAVSCYLAFYAPSENYMYRFSEADKFSQCIEFGKDIGSGGNFRLDFYYEMCDQVVNALKEHPSLLEKHFSLLDEKIYYRDDSLHLLAFDVIYCCIAYELYLGIAYIPKKESIKAFTQAEIREKERLKKEQEILDLKNEIEDLKKQAEKYSSISLVNVEVNHRIFGKGIIVSQDINKVVIKFESGERNLILSKNIVVRPTFENDTEIIEALTEYDNITQRIERLQSKLDMLQKN